MALKAYAPNGIEIIGTKELVPGMAPIHDWKRRDENGKLDFEWSGGTEMDWDNQRTVERDGKLVFLDADDSEWTEDQVELREEEKTDE